MYNMEIKRIEYELEHYAFRPKLIRNEYIYFRSPRNILLDPNEEIVMNMGIKLSMPIAIRGTFIEVVHRSPTQHTEIDYYSGSVNMTVGIYNVDNYPLVVCKGECLVLMKLEKIIEGDFKYCLMERDSESIIYLQSESMMDTDTDFSE